ncbi:MAG: glycosyltransferase [Alphaproteobacteria bacterium]|nr:glycosyltransferase [Alphaproteobacteria bacterium]
MTHTQNGKRRVLFIADMSWKRLGGRLISTDRVLLSGLWRGGHLAYEVSDRDMVKYLGGPLRRLGEKRVNEMVLDVARTIRPEVVLISNCRSITTATLDALRETVPGIRIGNYTLDPLFLEKNAAHQRSRAAVCDVTFATQAGPMLTALDGARAAACWMPNPVDPAFAPHRNGLRAAEDLPVDLLYCANSTPDEERWHRIGALVDALPDLRIDLRGLHGKGPVEGADYLDVLGQTKISISMNKEEHPLYASDRMAQLMGNGIATLIDRASGYQRFFAEDEAAAYYDDTESLIETVRRLAGDDALRRRIAEGGYRESYRLFASDRVADYMVRATLDPSVAPPWEAGG